MNAPASYTHRPSREGRQRCGDSIYCGGLGVEMNPHVGGKPTTK